MISEVMSCNNDNLIIEKTVSDDNVVIGDTLEFSIKVINDTGMTVSGITIIDNLECNLEFIKGTVTINNSCSTANILQGVNLACLKSGDIAFISFKAKVISMPITGYIYNFAIIKYFCDVCNCNKLQVFNKRSNVVCIKIDNADLEVVKTCDKKTASLGDIIEYTVFIKNVGTLEAIGLLFLDRLPKEVSLIPCSFKVNGETINYEDQEIKIYVGDLLPEECLKINYKVKINSSNCKSILSNNASVKYNYNLFNCSFGEKITECTPSSVSEVELSISTFKQTTINQTLDIPLFKPSVEEINNVDIEVQIEDYYEIKTPEIISSEGQILTGHKLIVTGVLKELIEYISEGCQDEICIETYRIPFSTFVVLPKDYVCGTNLSINASIEDIYYKKIDCRNIFISIALLINGKILYC